MLEPIDIAIEVHRMCEDYLIFKKMSLPHDITMHSMTTTIYAKAINDAGLHVTGKQAVQAIIQAAGWDGVSSWPGHPSTEKVIAYLQAHPDEKSWSKE